MTRESRLVPFFFFAAVFCATFEKVQWQVAGSVFLADLTATAFLVAFALDRLGRERGKVPRTAAVLLVFLGAFLLVTHGGSQINVYGAVNGASVYRPNALTGDPNHLGIALLMPLLILTPLYLRLERGNPWRIRLAVVIAFCLIVELATLSRSGALGLVVGGLVLLYPYRHLLFSRLALLPLALVLIPVAVEVYRRRHFLDVVVRSRLSHGTGASTHLDVYRFVPQILHMHPLFGLGFNNFSVYYEFVTGKTNWGPHSYYVALLVEGGLVGTALCALFLWYLFGRLGAARRLGRALAAARDPVAARLRPLACGLTAALVATMAANVFYLTMSFLYFYAFAMLVLVTPTVFARR